MNSPASSPDAPTTAPPVISVGRLAKATGISADTLRVWERRYGKPNPVRLPSGHRRYPTAMIPWLRKVAEGLARGSRPSQLLPLNEAELNEFLARVKSEPLPREVTQWIACVADSRIGELERSVPLVADRETVIDFLDGYVAPFMREIGSLWAAGKLEVRHEHLATDVMLGALRRVRNRLAARPTGPVRATILLANLPGEQHGLGLHMAATLLAEFGVHPRILGANTPLGEIAMCAQEIQPDAVAISVSLAHAGVGADRLLAQLRALMPSKLPLVVGGSGSRSGRRGPRGVRVLQSLPDLRNWIRCELLSS